MATAARESLVIPVAEAQEIGADLHLPDGAAGLIVFAHGSGSSRFSPRNRAVASALHARGFGTVLLDLLTRQEVSVDVYTSEYRFDIPRLGNRVVAAIDWLGARAGAQRLPMGCFGASAGAAAALIAAAERPDVVRAVVSRGGRPDLAGEALMRVTAPTLLIVGGRDEPVLELNEEARGRMTSAPVVLAVVAGATHLFEEPGTMEEVEGRAGDWFERHLRS